MILEGLTLFGIAFVGTVVFVLNPEATAVYYTTRLGWPPLPVTLICTAGQLLLFVVLYYAGAQLTLRWRWLARTVARTRARFKEHLERRYLGLSVLGAIIGIPPCTALSTLAAGFGVGLRPFLLIVGTGRALRFGLLAWGGRELLHWWSRISL